MIKLTQYLAIGRIALGVTALSLLIPPVQAQPKEPMPAMHGSMAASSAMTGSGMDMKAMMKDMSGKMTSMPMSGDPDLDFAMMMRIHHLGAIDMANAELSSGKDPQMKKMARGIIAAQKKEIAQFDAYLSKHGHPAHNMNK